MTNRGKKGNVEQVLCRSCGYNLTTKAEKAIGVHIGCVADSKFKKITIPRPQYGNVNAEQ